MIKVKRRPNNTDFITESKKDSKSSLTNAMNVKDSMLGKLDGKFSGDNENRKDSLKGTADTTKLFSNVLDDVAGKASSLTSNRASIIARAKNSVLQFPIYIVDNVNISVAHIVAKAFDRVYASFVQTVLSQHPIIDEDSINDLAFLRQFHTNLKESTDMNFNEFYQPIDDFDIMMQESVHNVIVNDNGITCRFNQVDPTDTNLISENSRLLNEPLSGFEHYLYEDSKAKDVSKINKTDKTSSVNRDLYDVDANQRIGVNESQLIDMFNGSKPEKPVSGQFPDEPKIPSNPSPEESREYNNKMKDWERKCQKIKDRYDNDKMKYEDDMVKYEADLEVFLASIRDGSKKVYIGGNIVKYDNKSNSYYAVKPGIKRIKTDTRTSSTEFRAPVMLRDADIKKINGMLPYTFDAQFTIKNSDGSAGNNVHYIIGVKSVLHLIKSQDLSDELPGLITGDIKTLQKVRYKTGEITFWKDYIFRKDQLKRDASKHLDSSKKWINTLKHLADYNKQHGTMFDKPINYLTDAEVPIPNATLILTQPVVQQIKNDTGIDLENVSMAKKLAKNLFLIAIVILDWTAGNMKVMFTDTDTSWDVQSIASIEAEVAKTDNSNIVKELSKAINK